MDIVTSSIATLIAKCRRDLHMIARQSVVVDDVFADTDLILDLGGGGEGVIGQLRGRQVVAVDLRKRELDEAPAGPLKVVADARNLPFPDQVFEAATAFFLLMYVAAPDRPAVFAEAYRVLVAGGRLYVWDVDIPAPDRRHAETFLVPVSVRLPGRIVRTMYGVRWDGRAMSAEGILDLARGAGFAVLTAERSDRSFHLVLERPRLP